VEPVDLKAFLAELLKLLLMSLPLKQRPQLMILPDSSEEAVVTQQIFYQNC